MIEYNLPEWAFLDARTHLGDQLTDRTVMLHVRSASVIEILNMCTPFVFAECVLKHDFVYASSSGVEELTAVLHYCMTLDKDADQCAVIEQILKPCSEFYINYRRQRDENLMFSFSKN